MSDALSVMKSFVAAVNAHDVESAVSHFAEEGEAVLAVETRKGPEAIRGWLQSLADGHFLVEIDGEPTVDGNTVRYGNKVQLDMFKNLGLPVVEAVTEATVVDGKITYYKFAPTPEYGAKIKEAIASGKKLQN